MFFFFVKVTISNNFFVKIVILVLNTTIFKFVNFFKKKIQNYYTSPRNDSTLDDTHD